MEGVIYIHEIFQTYPRWFGSGSMVRNYAHENYTLTFNVSTLLVYFRIPIKFQYILLSSFRTAFQRCLLLGRLGLWLLKCFRQKQFSEGLAAKQRYLLAMSCNLGRQNHWFQTRGNWNWLKHLCHVFIR